MQEMQDNNLFGDDSTPTTPAPHITEISLKDISSAVDLNEFRRQQREELVKHKLIKTSAIDESVDLPDWLTKPSEPDPSSDNTIYEPEAESASLSREISPGESLISRGLLECHDSSTCDRSAEATSFYASPSLEKQTEFELIEETLESDEEHVDDTSCGIPLNADSSHTARGDYYSPLPNGNAFGDKYRPLRLNETMDRNKCLLQGGSSGSRDNGLSRRASFPDKGKLGGLEPRKKRKSFNERSGRTDYSFNIDKFTKEELLCMWKSKELELNARLKEAVKDKEKLEHKLAGRHYSTPV